jgi:hypothetical protein
MWRGMMAINVYDVGDRVRLFGSFTVSGVKTNPTLAQCRVLKPDGTSTTYNPPAVVNDNTGDFHVDISVDQGGRWYYKWIGTGAVESVAEKYFQVRTPALS